MMPRIIGHDLLARGADGRLLSRIATVFPSDGTGTSTIVTLPGIHATQRIAYADDVSQAREAKGLPPLTEDEQEELWMLGVDLVIDEDTILIRPDPSAMDLAFDADETLQKLYSKKQIRFLHVMDKRVRSAIQRRGELWRICPLPQSPAEMMRLIHSARIAITARPIYYYNSTSGTRLLTCSDFISLSKLSEFELRALLTEIREYAPRKNRSGNPEIACFLAAGDWLATSLAPHDFAQVSTDKLKSIYESACHQFLALVPPEFQFDDPQNPRWRSAMYSALIGQTDTTSSEEALLGLSAEFFMQVQWVPGGRIEQGELILDSVFEEEDHQTCCSITRTVCNDRARGLIFNFLREYADIESVNIGRIAPSISKHDAYAEHREVYLAEIHQAGVASPILRIIRMQKRGVWELLDRGNDLLAAMIESEEYTESILDRRLACRQLGMHLPPHLWARKLAERYAGSQESMRGRQVWSTYFERDYIPGLATDKIPSGRFASDAFALAFARVLGHAAAANLIVGRGDTRGKVVFDDGDELLIENILGIPDQIIATDHTGTFNDCQRNLADLLPAYADCVEKRAAFLPSTRAFAEVFANAFEERFVRIQSDYRKRKHAFETLFKHKYPEGETDHRTCFFDQWACTLARLNATDASLIFTDFRKQLSLV
jgi:hypothetical protein